MTPFLLVQVTAYEPLPAESPIGGPLWTVVIPAVLLIGALVATWMLYRHFSREA